jgi:UDP:flavonoid glycosyltransferase YjiC (YdhE family)
MSRFLISTMPAAGHVAPALPLARALVERGHQVLWHTGPAQAARVAATGATFVPFGETRDLEEIPVVPDPGARGMAVGQSLVRRLFIDRMAGQVADYRRILQTFPADVIVADMCSLGAAAVHAEGGPVHATLGINPLVTLDPEIPPFGSSRPPARTGPQRLRNRLEHGLARLLFMPALTRALDAERLALGIGPIDEGLQLPDVLRSPFLHLMPTTEAFEYPRANLEPQVHFVGPLLPAPPPGFAEPSWWGELAHRTVVHITQGTYATRPQALLRPAIEGLADTELLLVVTTSDPAALGPLPGNVRWADFIPHARLLPFVQAMVTNAGYNGVLAALAHGVPLVCAGQTEDKANVSARVAWSGAGIDLQTDAPRPSQVRSAVRAVLGEPRFRQAAGRIRDDFARHDGPAEASALLERLATDQRPVWREGPLSGTGIGQETRHTSAMGDLLHG